MTSDNSIIHDSASNVKLTRTQREALERLSESGTSVLRTGTFYKNNKIYQSVPSATARCLAARGLIKSMSAECRFEYVISKAGRAALAVSRD